MATAVPTVSSLVLFDIHNANKKTVLAENVRLKISGCGMLIRGVIEISRVCIFKCPGIHRRKVGNYGMVTHRNRSSW